MAQLTADELYMAVDRLVASPTLENLQQLENSANTFNSKNNSSDEQLAVVIARCNLGYYFEKNGDFAKSIENYEDAYHRSKAYELLDYDIYENGALPLAALYTRKGEYLKAEELLGRCVSHAKITANNSLLYNTVLSLSALYNSTSRYEMSTLLINQTLKKIGIPPAITAALNNNLATSYTRSGDFAKAKQLLSGIIKISGINHVNAYKSLALIALKEDRTELALDYFKIAKSALVNDEGVSTRQWVDILVEEAELLLETGNTMGAQRALQKALSVLLPSHSGETLPDKSLLFPDRNFLRIFDAYAATATSLEGALASYELAFYVAILLQQNYTSQETKIIHQADVKHRTEKCLDLLWNNYSDTKELVWAETAFRYTEQSKSSVLMERTLLNNQQDAKSMVLENLLRNRDKLTDQLLRAQFKNLDTGIVEMFTSELAALDRQIKIEQSDLPQMFQPVLELAALQQKLKMEETVIQSYFLGANSNYQYTIDDSGVRMYRLPDTKELSPLISKFVHLFNGPNDINNDVPNFTKTAYEVFKVLQLNSSLNKKHLLLIPDGLLNFLPFESLLTEPTNGMSFSKMPFLAVSQKVAYAVNANQYLQANSNNRTKSVLGIFPIFKGSPNELSYSEEEAIALGNAMSAELVLESLATKNNFIKKSEDHDLIHLSTHAGSGDFVVPAYVQFYDDVMYLPELHSLDMDGKTIILSACETGIGKLQKGEGAISVARGFQYAGASSVLFSLWKVNDQSTASVMSSFYKSLKSTKSVFESNHRAKLSYLKDNNIPNVKKSPYYWNGFAYYGAIDFHERTHTAFWWLGVALLLLGVLALLLILRIK